MTSVAVVGAGYFGSELARLAAAMPGVKVGQIVDPHRGTDLAATLGATHLREVAALAGAEMDAVIIASPNGEHRAPALLAATEKVPVFCEKPIALNAEDCHAMVQACREVGVVFMAGHVTRFMHGVRRARALIDDGALGRLIYGRSARTGWEPPQEVVSWKKMRDLSGGHLFHHIHELDLIQALMGTPRRVSMAGGRLLHTGPGYGDEDDVLAATLDYGSAVAVCEWGSAMRWPEHYALVQGSKGAIYIDLTGARVTWRKADGTTEEWGLHANAAEDAERAESYRADTGGGGVAYGSPADAVPQWLRTIMVTELEVFFDAIAGHKNPEFSELLDGSAALESIATATALERSLAEQGTYQVLPHQSA